MVHGIIPARAGFTPGGCPRRADRRDHPRSRGVYCVGAPHLRRRLGSSPLARGLRGADAPRERARRIIPARAGFTTGGGRLRHPVGDHPRSRGVYASRSTQLTTRSGSSPLARGLRKRPLPHYDARGIIPARAGFTAPRRSPGAAPPDHPRSRGVYATAMVAGSGSAGSSPLARGLPDDHGSEQDQCWIIPARAGFTPRRGHDGVLGADHPRSRGVYGPRGR